jgi:hypothetical protein
MNQFKANFIYKNFPYIIFAVCLFLLSQPYFTWNNIILSKLLLFIILLISIINIRVLTRRDLLLIPFFIFFLLYLAISYSSNIIGIISLMTYLIVVLMKKSQSIIIFRYFKTIFSISLFLSLVIYILIVFFNFELFHVEHRFFVVGEFLKYRKSLKSEKLYK